MAKQDDVINGGYRGKVGPVVGYMWRGQWCTRTMPRFYHDAKTEAQLEQRELFKAEVAFAGRVKEVLHVGFRKPSVAAHKTECNYFLMVNRGCFAWGGDGMEVDYAGLRVSEGPVAPVAFGPVGFQDDTTLVIPFEKNPTPRRCEADDHVYVAAFCEGEAELSLPVYRRTRSITVALPAAWAGREVHLYGFVQDGAARTSESVYLGAVVLEAAEESQSRSEAPEFQVFSEGQEYSDNPEFLGHPGGAAGGSPESPSGAPQPPPADGVSDNP